MTPVKKLLYLISEDGYFMSHRFNLAKAAAAQGYEVHLATSISQHTDQIRAAGMHLHPLKSFNRTSINPLNQLRCLQELWQIYKKINPDIVHHVAIKPVLYGSLVALACGVPRIINALAGMGYVFIATSFKAKLLRIILIPLLRYIFAKPNQNLIVQNRDDYNLWLDKYKARNVVLIRGSGVDINKYNETTHNNEMPVILFPARMLWDKGAGELIAAAKILQGQNILFELWFCGDVDIKNPSSLTKTDLETWHAQGLIKWLGHQTNMLEIYHKSDIVVLPSYREGLPKSLLEAAACGKPMVASDVPGCREIVIHEKTGLLVPVKDAQLLAQALILLINSPTKRLKMGQAARKLVMNEFSDQVVIPATLQLYTASISNPG